MTCPVLFIALKLEIGTIETPFQVTHNVRNTKVLLNIVLTLSEQIMDVMDVRAQIEEKGRVLSQVKIKTNTSLP